MLGTDPKTGKEVSVKIGRFGPLVQLGSTDSEEKPQFASLQKGQSVSDITLEEALKLFELPRTLGDYEGETVTVAIGRFGPYVKHGKMFVSVPKTLSPQTITLDEAVELIKNKAEAEKKRLVKHSTRSRRWKSSTVLTESTSHTKEELQDSEGQGCGGALAR